MAQPAYEAEETVAVSDQDQFLTFSLSGEVYAIDILSVREIMDYSDLTAVPMMPLFIRGVINLRGSVVPVVDLAARFGNELAEITKRTAIIIIELREGDEVLDIGIVVDTVNDVLEIPADDIEPAPAFGANIRTDFVRGMGKVDGKFLILLDVSNVLSVTELSLCSDMQTESQGENADVC